jgi:predicted nucleic acid-binding protein
MNRSASAWARSSYVLSSGAFMRLVIPRRFSGVSAANTPVQVASAPLGVRLPDPDDEAFLEIAVASVAEYLVTGNRAHFPPEACAGVSVVSPSAFVEAYRSVEDSGST